MPRGISRLDEARHQGRLWTPKNLPTRPFMWFDAQDFATIACATGVSQWSDKSGNNRHILQASTTLQPLFAATDRSNRPAAVGDGVNDGLRANYAFTGAAFSVFAVAAWTATPPGDARLVSVGTAALGDADIGTALMLYYNSGNVLALGSGAARGTAFATSADIPGIWASIADGTNWQLFNNGTGTAATAFSTAFNFDWIGILDYAPVAATTVNWKGPGHEFVLLGYAPTTRDRERIEGYLAHKWRLTANLPGTHPYCNVPPLIGT